MGAVQALFCKTAERACTCISRWRQRDQAQRSVFVKEDDFVRGLNETCLGEGSVLPGDIAGLYVNGSHWGGSEIAAGAVYVIADA